MSRDLNCTFPSFAPLLPFSLNPQSLSSSTNLSHIRRRFSSSTILHNHKHPVTPTRPRLLLGLNHDTVLSLDLEITLSLPWATLVLALLGRSVGLGQLLDALLAALGGYGGG